MKGFSVKFMGFLIVFMLCLGAVSPIVNAAGKYPEQNIIITWHHYSLNKGFYNPADEGKSIKLVYAIEFEGYDSNGVLKKNLYSDWKTYNGTIGKNYTITINTDEMKANTGVTYKNITVTDCYIPVYKENPIYGFSYAMSPKTGEITKLAVQNMNTNVTVKAADNSNIPAADKAKMAIKYTVSKENRGNVTYPVQNNARKPIEATVPFKEGKLMLYQDQDMFYWAVRQNNLGQFSPYTGKYNDFTLVAEFDGPDKDKINNLYKLDVEGNDLDGWTVTVSRKADNKPPKAVVPKTGYNSHIGLYSVMALLSLMLFGIVYKKRTN